MILYKKEKKNQISLSLLLTKTKNNYLYGMCGALSLIAVMTRPRATSDWLFTPASRACCRTAPEMPIFSLPARSTRFNFPILIWIFPPFSLSSVSTEMVKMEWERLDRLLELVGAVLRFRDPLANSLETWKIKR